ncbi:TonB-dependent receptor domain-containing protein [Paraglaciecola sp. 2405UD69-4]|uniref:TonB-dependent receptor domain-containing protein n=1 Tax=Paraglaciecola sp. 2405UD69-4 TaxID=3391836 RepID=UPI0039C9EC33
MFTNSKLTKSIRLAMAAGAASTALISNVALAQDAETAEASVEKISVTGSRIQRANLTAKSPVFEFSGEEFVVSGNLNIEQKLAELPSTLPSFGASSNNPGDGTARVDLRGLGTSRTLVLVNGRRWIPATQAGVVDLNSIPGSLIEGVDIITGGSSAVYGSDALGGVVNFRMKDDFEGAEISTLYDITEDGDGEKFNIDLTIGGNFADDRGNATIYMGYAKRDAVYQGDRSFSDVALTEGTDGLVAGGSSGIPGTRIFGGPTLPNGDTLGRFLPDGSGATFVSPDDLFNYAPDNFLQLPQERLAVNGFGHFDITDDHRLYAEVGFNRNTVPQELAPTPAFTTVELNPNSVFFGADVQEAFLNSGELNADGNYEAFIGRRMVEVGPRQSIDTRSGVRILVGLEGYFNDNWGYNTYYSRSELDQTNLLENDVAASRFRQALLVTDDGTECQDTSNGCVPLNIFGEGTITEEAAEFIRIGATNVTNISQEVFHFDVAGELPFGLPSAENNVGLVVGFESRHDSSTFRPDEFLAAGDVLGFNAGDTTSGGYGVKELFYEIDVPLVEEKDFAKELTLWVAGRFSDYSTVGSVESFATSLNWVVNDTVMFRAGYQEAVRAPNVSELFLGQSNGFPSATDPCSADGFVEGTTDSDLCVATGLSADQVGTFIQANSQIEGVFGGNTELKEEESETVTLSVVLTPVEDLTVSFDYFNIEITDAIDVLGGGVQNVLNICYNQVQDINSPFCQAIDRRADGNVDTVSVLNENIGALETSGLDVNINYSFDLDFGIGDNNSILIIDSRNTFLDSFDITPVAELGTVNECAGAFGNTCGSPLAEFQSNNRITWASGDLSFSTLIRYIDSTTDDQIVVGGVDASELIVPEISSEVYVDLSASYHLADGVRVNAGITNLFANEPTALGDSQEQANTFPSTYDLLGRRFFVSATYTF